MSPGSEIAASKEAVKPSRLYVKEMADLASRKRFACWTMPPGVVTVQTFLVHITHFLGNLFEYSLLFGECLHNRLFQYSGKWHGRSYSMDMKTCLVLDTPACEIPVKQSAISRPDFRLCLLSSCRIDKDGVIGYYHDALVCETLT